MLVLGIGLAVAEEILIQQTSIAPLLWLGNTPPIHCTFIARKCFSRPTAKCSRPLRVTTFMFAARTLTPLLSPYASTKESPCPGGENADQTLSALRSWPALPRQSIPDSGPASQT